MKIADPKEYWKLKSPLQDIEICFATGILPEAQTDDPITVEFCPEEDKNCFALRVKAELLKERFDLGDLDCLTLSGGGLLFEKAGVKIDSMTPKDLQYVNVHLLADKGLDPNKENSWFLEGIKISARTNNQWFSTYVNPCVHRWLHPIDKELIGFSLRDQGACILVITASGEGAETKNTVGIAFPPVTESDPSEEYVEPEKIDLDAIYATGFTLPPPPKPVQFYLNKSHPQESIYFDGFEMKAKLDFSDYQDFSSPSITSYGFRFYNMSRLKNAFQIFKKVALADDPWLVAGIEVFIFKPGDPGFLKDKFCYYYLEKFSNQPFWLSEKTQLEYPVGGYKMIGGYKKIPQGSAEECEKLQEVGGSLSLGGYFTPQAIQPNP